MHRLHPGCLDRLQEPYLLLPLLLEQSHLRVQLHMLQYSSFETLHCDQLGFDTPHHITQLVDHMLYSTLFLGLDVYVCCTSCEITDGFDHNRLIGEGPSMLQLRELATVNRL